MGQTLENQVNEAIQSNNLPCIATFIKDHPTLINMPMVNNKTNPLCRAVVNNRMKIVIMLLDAGADIN